MRRHFEGIAHAAKYAAYRPTYPNSVFERIHKYCISGGNKFDLAIDVGCGSGQSTIPLSQHFKTVYGTDISEAQIAAVPNGTTNVIFKVSSAEHMPFVTNGTASLVTCAQAFHWLDLDKFYEEMKRILHPEHGALAVYGYGNVLLDNQVANSIINKFYTQTVGIFWDPQRSHIDDHYRRFKFPTKEFIRDDDLSLEKCMSVDDFIGYLSTWSAYQSFMKQNVESTALQDVHSRLVDIYGKPGSTVKATWPLFILLGRQFE